MINKIRMTSPSIEVAGDPRRREILGSQPLRIPLDYFGYSFLLVIPSSPAHSRRVKSAPAFEGKPLRARAERALKSIFLVT